MKIDKHEMEILDSTGHTRITWDADKADEVTNARRTYDDLRAKGYRAFRVKKDGGEGEAMREFDPHAERMIMVPPLVGG